MANAVAGVSLQVDATSAIQSTKRLKSEVEKLNGAYTDANGKLRDANGRFIATGKGAKAASVGVKGFGVALKSALGPVTAALAALTSLSAIFETLKAQDFAEAKVRSLGVNSDELVQSLKSVSAELQGQASVVELTAASYDVASAGFNNAADASKILKAASLGATGGFSDINTVANATTSVLNAYGLSADKAGKLVDGFIQTQNDGKIVIGEYANNIGKLAPLAASLNVPLEEINGAIAAVTATGINAEIGITGIRSALAKLGANSKEATDILKKYGVEINATTIGQEGFVKTLEKLSKVSNKTDLLKIVGVEAGQVVAPLLNDLEKLNQLVENQGKASGVAADAQAEAADTIQGALTRLGTAFSNLFAEQSALGEGIKNTIKVAAVTIEGLGTALNLILSPVKAIIAAVQAIGEGIAKAIGIDSSSAIADLEKGWQNLRKEIDTVSRIVVAFGSAFGGLIADLTKVAFKFGSDLSDAIGSPVEKLKNLWIDFTDFISSLWGGTTKSIASESDNLFSRISQGAFSIVGSIAKAFQDAFKSAFEQIQSFFESLPSWLQGALSGAASVGSAVTSAVGSALQGLNEAFGNAAATVRKVFNPPAVPDGVSTSTPDPLTQLNQPTGLGGASGSGAGSSATDDLKRRQETGKKLLQQQERRLALLLEQDPLQKELLKIDFERLDLLERAAGAAADQKAEIIQTIEALKSAEAGQAIGQALAEGAVGLSELQEKVRAGFSQGIKIDEEIKKANDEANVFKQTLEGVGQVLGGALRGAIDGLINGTAKLNDILSGVLKQIGSLLINAGFNALGNAGGGIGKVFSFLGFGRRANGGPVRPGGTYLVGERGPELLQMGQQGGFVQSNTSQAMNRFRGGGGSQGSAAMTVNYNVTEINGMRFVTEDQFRAGLDQAAQKGASMGKTMTINTLKNSRSQRSRVGL